MRVEFTPYWSADGREAKRIHEEAMALMGKVISSAEFEIISPEPRDHYAYVSPAPSAQNVSLEFSVPPIDYATGTIPAHKGLHNPFLEATTTPYPFPE